MKSNRTKEWLHEATLISLDARLRALATVFGIQGVWPQVLLMYARNLGSLSDISYSLATMHQLFANRSFVSVSADDLACMAYQGTEWLKFGLRRFTKYIAQPEIDFTSAFQVSVGFLHHLVSAGPCHFGALCQILEFVSEGLFRHNNTTTELSNRLFQEVLMGISSRDLTNLKSQLLAESIRNGEKNAKLAEMGEFINVQVLMCSSVPYIAYVPENHSLSAGRNDLLQIKNSEHRPSQGDFSTSASNISNSHFR